MLEKLCSNWWSSLALLSGIDSWELICILFSFVTQWNNRFTKANSCSVPLMSWIPIFFKAIQRELLCSPVWWLITDAT
jgi:hypothetical protein